MKSFLETLLNEKFLESFWYEISEKEKLTKKITERDLQRTFVFQMKCHYPAFFTKMVSDIPGVSASVGYDITINSPDKTIYIEAKILKNFKVQDSQISFYMETKGFDFIEYFFIFFDVGIKKIHLAKNPVKLKEQMKREGLQ